MATGTISMGHRHWGQPGKITYPGGSQRQNDYDPLLRLKQIQVKSAGQQPLMNWQYRFDAESNITGKQTEYGDTAYGYDSLYRLTQVTPSISSGPGLPTERYTYDKLGNRLTDNNRGGTNTWQYDGNNQLTQSFNADQQAVTEHYDANGSLIRKSTPTTDPYNNQKYLYDAGNRLTEVQTPTGDKIASYQYDPLGRRIRKTEYRSLNGSAWLALATPRTTTFFYTDEGLAAEYQHTGSNPAELKTQYGWEPNGMWGTSPLFLKTARVGETSPEYFYAQNDHLGTPQQLIDQAGNLVWAQRAEAFGKTNVVLEKVENNLRFPGQYYDQETNTHYNYFRDYDPNVGRYRQVDPIGLLGGNNVYAYVEANPTGFIDVNGLDRSGSPYYNPEFYNQNPAVQNSNNCYSYAINRWNNPVGDKPQPGGFSGKPYEKLKCPEIIAAAKRDGLIAPTDQGCNQGECPNGYHKVWLFISPPSGWFDSGVFGSFEALLQWVEENNGVLPIKTQVVVYDSTTKFVAIMHDKGFGVRAIDAYIYVCTPIRCGIFAMRATGSGDLNVVLSKGKQELILRSAKGDIYLRMPLLTVAITFYSRHFPSLPNNPNQPSPKAAPASRSALRQRSPGIRADLATFFICVLLGLPLPSTAQVNLPNGGVSENVVDLRVKTVGGLITVDRQFEDGRWHINLRWAPATLGGEVVGSMTCKAYPELKIQGLPYTGDGQSWLRENRYSVRVTGYFDGSDCPANRLKTVRWLDRNTGQWMDYERASAGDLQLKLVRYGNRNDLTTQLIYDPQGKLQSVKDHQGNTVLQYLYTGEQLTEIRDNPGLIPGNTAAPRAVKYTYTNLTNSQGTTYPSISQVTDVLGNITRYTYTGTYLATLTDPEGRIRRYDYTADRVTQYTDADGQVTRYVYDYDKLKKEFYARTTHPATAAGSRIVEQWYDLDGRVVRRDVNGQSEYRKGPTDTATRSETRTDGAGRQTVTTQDEYGNTIKTVYPDGSTTSAKYSAVHGQLTEETDELGIKTQYQYDSKGNLLKKTEAVGLPEERITDYEVNSLGQITKETRKGQAGAPGASGQDASVSYVYDNRGNRSTVTDPLGKVSRYTYDLIGNVTQLTDAASRNWKAEYDAAGRLTARIDPLNQRSEATYDKLGNRIKSTDALGNITRFTVDGQNRVTQTTHPLGGIRQTTYDALGRVIAEINEAGQTVARSTYDAQGRLLGTQDAAGNTTDYEYDASQNPFAPVRMKFAGLTRDMRFDSRDRVIEQTESWRETDANGQEQTRSATSKSVYNPKGQQIESLDRLGNKTQMAYDPLGRLKSVTDAQGGITQFAYDTRDNLLSLTDANGNTTRFEYDANNRKTKETRPLGQSTIYTYDPIGQLTEVLDAQGNKQRYTHDNAGRASKEEHLNAAGTVTRTITSTVNAVGTLTGIADNNTGHADHPAWRTTITVDALQRKTREDITQGSQTVTFSTTYSPTGKKASQSLADGTVPGTGRYVQRDPIGYFGGMNVYGYVYGNPLALKDVLGLVGANEVNPYAQAGVGVNMTCGALVRMGRGAPDPGQLCRFCTGCVRFGPGLFIGAGVSAGGGVVQGNAENLGGIGVGIGGDIGWGAGVGGAVGVGLSGDPARGDPGKVMAVGGTTGARYGVGFGASVGVDYCRTTIKCTEDACSEK
ncbi:hypothetical protein B566_EDAN017775 [Ephemera danica]|nr:hypothetical protein B566_EDAN017775 [Ephemera danica]